MSNRFFADAPVSGETFQLLGEQAHHLAHVMRKKVGDDVVLFDGSGREYRAEILSIKKRCVELLIVANEEVSRELCNTIMIATALPKGDRQRFLIEKLVELGVAKMLPLKTTRSVADANEKVQDRLCRQVIEASKQCGRNRLMVIGAQLSIPELISQFDNNSISRLLADPHSSRQLDDLQLESSAIIAIGPEGGFTDGETEQLMNADWQPVGLGKSVLRIETAAIAAATLLGIGRP